MNTDHYIPSPNTVPTASFAGQIVSALGLDRFQAVIQYRITTAHKTKISTCLAMNAVRVAVMMISAEKRLANIAQAMQDAIPVLANGGMRMADSQLLHTT